MIAGNLSMSKIVSAEGLRRLLYEEGSTSVTDSSPLPVTAASRQLHAAPSPVIPAAGVTPAVGVTPTFQDTPSTTGLAPATVPVTIATSTLALGDAGRGFASIARSPETGSIVRTCPLLFIKGDQYEPRNSNIALIELRPSAVILHSLN